MRVVCDVNAWAGQSIGVKEQVAMALEHIGDVRVVSVEALGEEQMRIGGNYGKTDAMAR